MNSFQIFPMFQFLIKTHTKRILFCPFSARFYIAYSYLQQFMGKPVPSFSLNQPATKDIDTEGIWNIHRSHNDTCGHAQGDECLKAVAGIFKKTLRRAGDLAARYGGEEFVAVLPDTATEEATFLAEKIREDVESVSIKHNTSKTAEIVTINIGTCTAIPDAEMNPSDRTHLADKPLYQAKNNGRNKVVALNNTTVSNSSA